MMILLIGLTVLLACAAVLHALWGFGIWVPLRNEEALVHAVVGARGVTRMPGPIPCFLVAAGLLVVALALWLPEGPVRAVILWAAATVFVLRGLMAYVPLWRRMAPEQPFASNDKLIYGPLLLSVGGALIAILTGAI